MVDSSMLEMDIIRQVVKVVLVVVFQEEIRVLIVGQRLQGELKQRVFHLEPVGRGEIPRVQDLLVAREMVAAAAVIMADRLIQVQR